MFVGGCVRNYLQSKKIFDIDIATIFTPDELKKLLDSKFKVIDTGLEHGSVTVTLNSTEFTIQERYKTIADMLRLKLLMTGKKIQKKRFYNKCNLSK